MKKLFAILLCIAMMLSMVACGGNQDNGENLNDNQGNVNAPNENEQSNGDPSEEESWEISYYVSAMEALNKFAESGDLDSLWFAYARYGMEPQNGVEDVWGSDALKEYYNLIKTLDAVDKWGGTAATEGTTGINWNRQEVLDRFDVVENVKLAEIYTVYDPVGNTTNLEMNWNYQADGTLSGIRWDSYIGERYQHAFVFNPIEIDPLHLMMMEDESGATFVSDDTGKLAEVKIMGGGETKFLGKLTYGDNGEVSSATVTSADGRNGTLSYSYDAQDRLTEVSYSSENLAGNVYYTNTYWEGYGEKDWYGSSSFTYTYTYNADGKVATKTYSGYSQWDNSVHSVVTEYSYDATGNLSGAVCERKYNSQSNQSDIQPCTIKDTYTFVCDAQGNPVSATINCGDTLYEGYTDICESPKIEIECVYGNLYSYNPAK